MIGPIPCDLSKRQVKEALEREIGPFQICWKELDLSISMYNIVKITL